MTAIAAYITQGNLDNKWGGGEGLETEASLNYVTEIIGPPICWTSTSDMTLIGYDAPIVDQFTHVRQAATNYGILCSPYLYGNIDDLGTVIANNLIGTLCDNIHAFLDLYSLDGINLNMEGGTNSTYMATLIDALYTEINSEGKFINIAAVYGQAEPPAGGYTFDITIATSAKVNYIMLMTYDMWAYEAEEGMTSPAYPHSPTIASQMAMGYWADAGYAKSKLLMGIPFYGKSIYVETPPPESLKVMNYDAIIDAVDPPITADSATTGGYEYWYGGPNTDRVKAAWCVDNGYAGVMIFALGYDKLNHAKSLIAAIYDELAQVTVTPGVVTLKNNQYAPILKRSIFPGLLPLNNIEYVPILKSGVIVGFTTIKLTGYSPIITGLAVILKRWNGNAWINTTLQTYTGTWQTKPLKYWNGSQWTVVDISGG